MTRRRGAADAGALATVSGPRVRDEPGGENFLRLTLLALTHMGEEAASASPLDEGDGEDSYRV